MTHALFPLIGLKTYVAICLALLAYPIAYAQDPTAKAAPLVLRAQHILAQNALLTPTDTLPPQLAYEMAQLQHDVQESLKSGDPEARVDLFLWLDGLVWNHLTSLQAILALAPQPIQPTAQKDFLQNLGAKDKEKIIYAQQENQHLPQVTYSLKDTHLQSACLLVVNGFSFGHGRVFTAPAGLPYYVGVYCPNTYAVQKIQSAPAQEFFSIGFTTFQPYPKIHTKTPNQSPHPATQTAEIPAQQQPESPADPPSTRSAVTPAKAEAPQSALQAWLGAAYEGGLWYGRGTLQGKAWLTATDLRLLSWRSVETQHNTLTGDDAAHTTTVTTSTHSSAVAGQQHVGILAQPIAYTEGAGSLFGAVSGHVGWLCPLPVGSGPCRVQKQGLAAGVGWMGPMYGPVGFRLQTVLTTDWAQKKTPAQIGWGFDIALGANL